MNSNYCLFQFYKKIEVLKGTGMVFFNLKFKKKWQSKYLEDHLFIKNLRFYQKWKYKEYLDAKFELLAQKCIEKRVIRIPRSEQNFFLIFWHFENHKARFLRCVYIDIFFFQMRKWPRTNFIWKPSHILINQKFFIKFMNDRRFYKMVYKLHHYFKFDEKHVRLLRILFIYLILNLNLTAKL